MLSPRSCQRQRPSPRPTPSSWWRSGRTLWPSTIFFWSQHVVLLVHSLHKWCVSILSSWSTMFYLSQLGKFMKLAIPLPSSAVATVVKCKISQWVWSTKRPSGISQTAGYGPRVWEDFFHRVTLGHWLFLWEAVSASLLGLPTRLSSFFPHVMDLLFPSAPSSSVSSPPLCSISSTSCSF